MVVLSGEVSQSNLSPMDVFMQQYGDNIAAATGNPAYAPAYQAPVFDLGINYDSAPVAYTLPISSYPTLPVSVPSQPTQQAPVNVQLAPVQQSSVNVQSPDMQFPGMPSFSPEGAPGYIQVGGRMYPANSVIAQAPQVSFAPGGVPQADTVTDAMYGYTGTAIPNAPQPGQPLQMNGVTDVLPDKLLGMDNPYMKAPQAPIYSQTPEYQAAAQVMPNAINALPNVNDYLQAYGAQPMTPLTANPLSWLKRGLEANPRVANQRAAQNAAALALYNADSQRATTLMQTMGPSTINLHREAMQQRGADYRTAMVGHNNVTSKVVDFLLDQKANSLLGAAKALDTASQAYLMPSYVQGPDGQPMMNRQKAAMLRAAGRELGWSESDVYGLMQQQDPNAANQLKRDQLAVEKQAFDLKSAKASFDMGINRLKAEINKIQAETAATYGRADAEKFNLAQRQAIAKYERWGMIADSMDKVNQMLVGKGTKNARVRAADLANQNTQAEIAKRQMEAKAVPMLIAARIASAMAMMSNSGDDQTVAIGKGLVDSLYATLGLPTKPQVDPNTQQVQMVPVQAPDTVQSFRQGLGLPGPVPQGVQMSQPIIPGMVPRQQYRQPTAPQQLPPNYFTGEPLSTNNQPAYGNP
jgi:hypothetical protein